MGADVVIVGAGVAGLAAAAELTRGGARVRLLDKSRGPGGRVATRRVNGQPTDHGVCFLHGEDPAFLAALDAVPATRLEGWPARVTGHGPPCAPGAFDGRRGGRRLAFAEGLSAFPRSLAEGLDLRLGARVLGLEAAAGGWVLHDEAGGVHEASAVVLALPVEQSQALLASSAEASRARALLGLIGTVPCHTVIAGYPGDDEPLEFELFYPEVSSILQLVSHDSSKRPGPRERRLVLQARAAWSAEHLETPSEAVTAALLSEAARLLGPWAGSPHLTQHHRWRFARIPPGEPLGGPYLEARQGRTLGVVGEAHHPSGGVEGAFLSGRALARRLLGANHA